jgi:hypothetical protein
MSGRGDHRQLDRHRVAWWVVAAWCSLALLVLAGLVAAAGVELG